MARPAGPGRDALVSAGQALLAEGDTTLGSLSVNAVVSRAGMSKGAFFQHFPSRRDYVLELHRNFHDGIAAELGAAIAGVEPGAHRLHLGMDSYLDACLRGATAKAWLFQARADVDLADEVAARNSAFAELAAEDIRVLGFAQPAVVARLVIAAIAEVALIEAQRGRRDQRYRRAVMDLVASPPAREGR